MKKLNRDSPNMTGVLRPRYSAIFVLRPDEFNDDRMLRKWRGGEGIRIDDESITSEVERCLDMYNII